MHFHPWGRRVCAAGNSVPAARVAGISLTPLTLSVFAMVGCFTGVSAILQTSLLYGAQPGRGYEFELAVIAVVVLGGTSLRGGAGSVMNTFAAAIFWTALQSLFQFINVNPHLQKVIVGVVLLFAFSLEQGKDLLLSAVLRKYADVFFRLKPQHFRRG